MALILTLTSIALITLIVLLYMGFGATRLLAVPLFHGQELLIAPFVGFALLVTLGYWCGWMGWSATVGLTAALPLATLVNLLTLRQAKESPLHVLEHVPMLVLACLTLAVALYPMWQTGRLGPIGSLGDQVLYANVAAHLEHAHLPTSPTSEWQPALRQLALAREYGLPLGFSYLHAVVNRLSQREAHETFAIVTAIAPVLAMLAYAALARCLFRIGPRGTLVAATLVALSPTLLWVHHNSYAMHVMSLGLVPLAFGAAVLAWDQGRRQLSFAALILSTAFVTYPVATIVFATGPLMVFVVQRCVQERRQLPSHLRRLGLLLAIMLIVNVPGVVHAGTFLLFLLDVQSTLQFGDVYHYAQWTDLFGLSHLRLAEEIDFLHSIPWLPPLVGAAAVVLALYGAWQTRKRARAAFISLAIVDVAFMLWLRYIVDYPYGYFKALTYATFPAIMAFSIGIEQAGVGATGLVGKLRMALVIALVAGMVAVNSMNSLALSRWVARATIDLRPFSALRSVEGVTPASSRIHIRDAQGTHLLWMTYFLKDYHLALGHYSDYYVRRDWPFFQQVIASDLVLVNAESVLGTYWAKEAVYTNQRFKLLRKDARIVQHLDFEEGARPLEPGETLSVKVFAKHVTIDNRSFRLDRSIHPGQIIRLGIFAPAGEKIRVNTSGSGDTMHLEQDLSFLEWPLGGVPWEMTLTNEGARRLWIPGWVGVVDKADGRDHPPMPGDIFTEYHEDVIPQSGFFQIRGWHALEEGKQRWTRQEASALFRNPQKSVVLDVAGVLLDHKVDSASPRATIRLNGHVLGMVNDVGPFRQPFFVPEHLLGSSQWGELDFQVSTTFKPGRVGLAQDTRDLGILITNLALVTLDLAPDGVIDVGTPEARKHLWEGWSIDERTDEITYVWADAPESLLSVELPDGSDFAVDLRTRPFYDPSSPSQGLSVYVNGAYLQDLVLQSGVWQTLSFALPRAFVKPGMNSFRFVYRYAVSPAEIDSHNHDTRTLAMAVDYIRIRPLPTGGEQEWR